MYVLLSFTDEVHMFSKINRNIYKPPVSEAVSILCYIGFYSPAMKPIWKYDATILSYYGPNFNAF